MSARRRHGSRGPSWKRAAQEDAPFYLGLAISSAIIAGTFAFGNWFATRLRLRMRLRLRATGVAWPGPDITPTWR